MKSLKLLNKVHGSLLAGNVLRRATEETLQIGLRFGNGEVLARLDVMSTELPW